MKKQKRVPLSIKRLYKLVQPFCKNIGEVKLINEYLKFVDEHKNDTL